MSYELRAPVTGGTRQDTLMLDMSLGESIANMLRASADPPSHYLVSREHIGLVGHPF